MADLVRSEIPCAVVTTYSWDTSATRVVLFPNAKAAASFLVNCYEEEVSIDEENGRLFECAIDADGTYAKIVNFRASGDIDTTEWYITEDIYSQK